jgi:hypothetical protein
MWRNSWQNNRMWIGAMAIAAVAFAAPAATAQNWNERTELKFSSPVMVPGATLEPGTYIFRLTDSQSNRHLVEIARKDGETITLTQAVPTKRMDAKGDVVLKFNPTEAGEPPAIAAWFYPGSTYGHQFVYSDEEARKIAERTKTLVLSSDAPASDMQQGTLRVYDASGVAKDWQPDSEAASSWEKWNRDRWANAGVVRGTANPDRARSTAPVVDAQFEGTRVNLDALENESAQWIGKKVSVDAEVEEVYGPRVFSIDEPNWADLDGEILVYVPSTLAALVREDDRVTVSGTVKKFVKADFENDWGWLDTDNEIEARLSLRPVLVAERVIGGNNNRALVVAINQQGTQEMTAGDRPVGTSGTTGAAVTMSDLTALGKADDDVVGRTVNLTNVRVASKAGLGGFYTQAGETTLFVLPAPGLGLELSEGDTVSLEGFVMQLPRHMEDRLEDESRELNDDVYVYATRVNR